MYSLVEKHIKLDYINGQFPFIGTDHYYHYLYVIINQINSKFYVGKHSTENLSDDYFGSSRHLKNSITKYGRNNFTKVILSYYNTGQDAYFAEDSLITIEMLVSEDCYNVKGGGHGFGYSDKNFSKIKAKSLEGHWAKGNENPAVLASNMNTHWWSNSNRDQSWRPKPWMDINVKGNAVRTWADADIIYSVYDQQNIKTYRKLLKHLKNNNYGIQTMNSIVNKFKAGWIPDKDQEWLKFKQDYRVIADEQSTEFDHGNI